ncbi:hypothetical protein ILUMI_27439 [Ignelater luminosus]|uniref:Cytochrome P450 n=1 Tax=Ignelater luminosus TaxID=2038154 RepID=A0A8K0C3F8_IGNLU|nr:hypothetical protein ILUMI_27439 [Ignelater luminosus]
MMMVWESFVFHILTVIITVSLGVYTYFQWAFKYWEKKGIPYVTPNFPFGTIKLFSYPPLPFGEMCKQYYNEYKAKGYKHVGLYVFSRPLYLVLDVEYIRNILSKDFDHFVDRGIYYNEKDDALSGNLFTIEGTKWKNLRAKITPTFTSGKMKMMFQILVESGSHMKDAIDIMRSKDSAINIKDTLSRFTMNTIGSYAFGHETSSTTMTFCLFELTQHLDIQENVRQEINEVLKRHNGEITYDALTEMKYMGQVINETLRKYPPSACLNRKCVKDYKLPDTNIEISSGTAIAIPVLAVHHDPEYFTDPEKFDPDRFSEENKSLIKPYTYLPFGEGPRICIGLRFGLLQTKMGLAVLLKNYRFTLNEKTKLPLKMDPFSTFVSNTEEDIWLNVEKIKQNEY